MLQSCPPCMHIWFYRHHVYKDNKSAVMAVNKMNSKEVVHYPNPNSFNLTESDIRILFKYEEYLQVISEIRQLWIRHHL